MFHICLGGAFHLFSFVFMDFKITVENSLSGDCLPIPGAAPVFHSPLWIGVRVLSSVENPQRGWLWENGETQRKILQPQVTGGFSPFLGFHLP